MYIANVLAGWASPLQQASNVTHDFESGKIHGIIGNNKSGKTVLFKCICGFIRPTKGQILVYNQEVGERQGFPRLAWDYHRVAGFPASIQRI
jgi:ABC-type uncharacterized transport system ATPase subunit